MPTKMGHFDETCILSYTPYQLWRLNYGCNTVVYCILYRYKHWPTITIYQYYCLLYVFPMSIWYFQNKPFARKLTPMFGWENSEQKIQSDAIRET